MTRIGAITVLRTPGLMATHHIGVIEDGVLKMAKFMAVAHAMHKDNVHACIRYERIN